MTIDLQENMENSKYKDGVNRNARLCVRNISFKATEDSLREYFSKYGTIEEVKLLKKPDGRLIGCGFVHYTQVPMANKALAATNKKEFLGRPISVAWAVPKHKYGDGADQKSSPKPSKSVKNSVSENEAEDKPIKNENEQKKSKIASKARINRNARLIIRNVSFKATEETLKQHFEPYGIVQEVKLLKKPDGKLVGCAFVHYKNIPMAKKALLNTNMQPFLGRPISVDWAVAKNKYMSFMDQQQLQIQDEIKKEDPDSDDDNYGPINITTDDIKDEIKDESGESDDDETKSDDEEEQSDDDDDDGNDDEEEEEEDDIGDDDDDTMSVQTNDTQSERKRIQLNDAEDGCTVFLTNIPFSIDNNQLRAFAEKHAPVTYALVCVDRMTEHSRGTGFVKFTNKDDADKFLSLTPTELRLEGNTLSVKPALTKDSLHSNKSNKQPKDNRNLYLVKEGVIVAGTKAAVGVSATDMSKRLILERSKTQMLKNLNRFVSRYRLVVSNLTPNIDDGALRNMCAKTVPNKSVITECRVMRNLREPIMPNGKHPSKGYGFVMFTKHEDAILCLRKLNNNPDIFDKHNRPIVSFSIEDRTALNARKKRLEKSIANNPLANKDGQTDNHNNKNRKRKQTSGPDESKIYNKKGKNQRKFDKPGQFVKLQKQNDTQTEFSGLTAKEGTQHKLRSFQKLRTQQDVHRQNVKLEKKKSQRTIKLKQAARERIKQPKQKINKNNKKNAFSEKSVKAAISEGKSFTDMVTKYKTKLVGNNEVKKKWYES